MTEITTNGSKGHAELLPYFGRTASLILFRRCRALPCIQIVAVGLCVLRAVHHDMCVNGRTISWPFSIVGHHHRHVVPVTHTSFPLRGNGSDNTIYISVTVVCLLAAFHADLPSSASRRHVTHRHRASHTHTHRASPDSNSWHHFSADV